MVKPVKDAVSTAVAIPAPTALTPQAQAAIAEFETAVTSMMAADNDFQTILTNTIVQAMTSDNVDDMLDFEPEDGQEEGALSLSENLGKPFVINSVELRASEKENSSLPCYAVMHTDLGVMTTGAYSVVIWLIARQVRHNRGEAGMWPTPAVIGASRETNSGNTVIFLRKVRPDKLRAPEQTAMDLSSDEPF